MKHLVTAEKRTVYRTAGGCRGYLTLYAAVRAEGRARIRDRCECEAAEYPDPGYTCVYHDLPPEEVGRSGYPGMVFTRADIVLDRYVRLWTPVVRRQLAGAAR